METRPWRGMILSLLAVAVFGVYWFGIDGGPVRNGGGGRRWRGGGRVWEIRGMVHLAEGGERIEFL